jgi:hypothetical protein
LVRQYWSIENGTHYPLDVSAGEDRCHVRHPVAPFKEKRGPGYVANHPPAIVPVSSTIWIRPHCLTPKAGPASQVVRGNKPRGTPGTEP